MKDKSRKTRQHRAYRKAEAEAAEIAEDPGKLQALIERAKARLSGKARPSFEEIWDDVQTSFRMVLAYARRDYREIPVKSIVLIAASSIYFLLTFDVIPDFIPLIGFADDLSLYIWTLKQVHDDLEAFRTWERSGNV